MGENTQSHVSAGHIKLTTRKVIVLVYINVRILAKDVSSACARDIIVEERLVPLVCPLQLGRQYVNVQFIHACQSTWIVKLNGTSLLTLPMRLSGYWITMAAITMRLLNLLVLHIQDGPNWKTYSPKIPALLLQSLQPVQMGSMNFRQQELLIQSYSIVDI